VGGANLLVEDGQFVNEARDVLKVAYEGGL
jgi:hypothetical protein